MALDLSKYDEQHLTRDFQLLFSMADINGDGVLEPAEFHKLLKLSGFDFDNLTVAKLMSQADTNHDGVIQYAEFIPVAVRLLMSQAAPSRRTHFPVAPIGMGLLKNRTLALILDVAETIRDIKDRLALQEEVPAEWIVIYVCGIPMDDSWTVQECNLQPNSTIHIMSEPDQTAQKVDLGIEQQQLWAEHFLLEKKLDQGYEASLHVKMCLPDIEEIIVVYPDADIYDTAQSLTTGKVTAVRLDTVTINAGATFEQYGVEDGSDFTIVIAPDVSVFAAEVMYEDLDALVDVVKQQEAENYDLALEVKENEALQW